MRWSALPAPLRVLLHGQFGLFTGGNTLSLTGTWMQRIAAGWLVWDWTGSAFWLGVLAVGDLLPVIVVGPLAGVAADRWDRLKQNRIAQILSAVLALVLAVMLLCDLLDLTCLLVLVTLQGTLVAVVQPARLAMVQEMVPKHELSAAVAINSVNVNLARLLGPAAAGLMIIYVNIVWVFVLNALFTAVFIVILSRLRLVSRDIQPTTSGFVQLMREGFAYAVSTPTMRIMLCLLLMAGAGVRSMLELLPAIAAQSFLNVTSGLAFLTGAAAAGAMVSGLSARGEHSVNSILLWWGAGALAAYALTCASYAVLAMLAAMVMGAAITRGMVGTQTLIQLATPDALRGRVLSIHGLIARGSPALGALPIGYGSDLIGLQPTMTIVSSLLLIVIAVLWLRTRAMDLGPR